MSGEVVSQLSELSERVAVAGGAVLLVDKERDGEQGWLEARRTGVTATEVAKLHNGGAAARKALLEEKRVGSSFTGNAYTEHGKAREPIIGEWVARKFGMLPCSAVFAHPEFTRHLASPDMVGASFEFDASLAEMKTTMRAFDSIPPQYFDQMQWQMHVMQAEHVLFVWEQHEDFVPVDLEPRYVWVKRDEQTIAELVKLADEFLLLLDGQLEVIDETVDELARVYLESQADEARAKGFKDAAGKQIRAVVGDNPSFKQVGRYGMVTRTISPVKTETVERESFDVDQFRADFPDLYASYVQVKSETVTTGGRETLRVTAHRAKEIDGE